MACNCGQKGEAGLWPGSGRTIVLPLATTIIARSRFAGQAPPPAMMSMADAIAWVDQAVASAPPGTALEIGGQGDPLAELDLTLAVASEISRRHPGLAIGLRSLGVGCASSADRLAAAGISRVRLLVNACDLVHLEKIYAWIRPGRKTLKLAEAGVILLDEQEKAGPALRAAGLALSVHTEVFADLNDGHVGAIARTMAGNGAEEMSISGWRPEPGSDVALLPPSAAIMAAVLAAAGGYLPVTESVADETDLAPPVASQPQPTRQRPNVAVVSASGMTVDLHLGQADRLLIYGPRADGLVCLLETRPAPAAGGSANRWMDLAAGLTDCFALIAASAGDKPRQVLAEQGIRIFISEDTIDGLVDALYGGGKKGKGCGK